MDALPPLPRSDEWWFRCCRNPAAGETAAVRAAPDPSRAWFQKWEGSQPPATIARPPSNGRPPNRGCRGRSTRHRPAPTKSASGGRSICRRALESCPIPLAEPRLECRCRVRFFVAVFDYHRRLKRDALALRPSTFDGPRAGHDHGVLRNHQTLPSLGAMDRFTLEIVHRRSPRQYHPGSDHRSFAYDRAFVDPAIAADDYIVLYDNRRRVDGFQYAAQLRRSAEMNALAHMSAGSNQRVRVYHRSGSDMSADIDVHRRHADHTTHQISAPSDAGSSGNDSDPVGARQSPRRIGVLVEKGKHGVGVAVAKRHVDYFARAKAEQDAALHP